MAGSASSPAPSRHPGALRAWLVWWALLFGLWLALVDTVKAPELAAGAVSAAVAATGAVLVRAQRRTITAPDPVWLRSAARPLLRVLFDLGPLVRVLWRRGVRRGGGHGALVETPYPAVGDDPRHAAHRVFTQALGSLGPNTLVVEIDTGRRVLLVHQLEPTGDPAAAAQPLPDP